MSLKLSNGLFVLTTRGVPANRATNFVLDTNVIHDLVSWANLDRRQKEGNRRINNGLETLDFLQKQKSRWILWQIGALERSWTQINDQGIDARDLRKINGRKFEEAGRIIEKINSASEEEMHIWKMANRVSKIPPIDLQSWKSRLHISADFEYENYKEMAVYVSGLWLGILLLMESLEALKGGESFDELSASYHSWLDSIFSLGVATNGDMFLIAELCFFGGTIAHSYYEGSYVGKKIVKTRLSGKDIIKWKDWKNDPMAKIKISRNVAFDLLCFHVKNFMDIGTNPFSGTPIPEPRREYAILTRDKAMNAINNHMKTVGIHRGRPERYYKPAEDSPFINEYHPVLRFMRDSAFDKSSPTYRERDLPDLDELMDTLEKLISGYFQGV